MGVEFPNTGGIPGSRGTALEDIVSITTGDFRSKITSSTLLEKKQRQGTHYLSDRLRLSQRAAGG